MFMKNRIVLNRKYMDDVPSISVSGAARCGSLISSCGGLHNVGTSVRPSLRRKRQVTASHGAKGSDRHTIQEFEVDIEN